MNSSDCKQMDIVTASLSLYLLFPIISERQQHYADLIKRNVTSDPEVIEKRIELLNSNEKEVENIEIRLLSTEDDLSLIDLINANISSIHLPLPPFCNLTFISDSLKAKDSNYDFILRGDR